jgi:hypothetical protein
MLIDYDTLKPIQPTTLEMQDKIYRNERTGKVGFLLFLDIQNGDVVTELDNK